MFEPALRGGTATPVSAKAASNRCRARPLRQCHQAADLERQNGIELHPLRQIADAHAGTTLHGPGVGLSKPSSTRISVVLPAPFGPMTVTISPGAMLMSILSRITCEPYATLSERPAINGSRRSPPRPATASFDVRGHACSPNSSSIMPPISTTGAVTANPADLAPAAIASSIVRRLYFGDSPTPPANQELRGMKPPAEGQATVSVEAFDPMNQAVAVAEIPGPGRRRWEPAHAPARC